ncbi:MAG TPA: uroporphyrinogen-III synthase [Candidatus Aquilonibacter sp.]|nr:uroporphyrinogen-III synthase [Candidatus Aquilonibacter sp.]
MTEGLSFEAMEPRWQSRILVTRSEHQASELAERLREFGLEPLLIPVIGIADPISFKMLDDAIASMESFDWIVFTSANAVEAAQRRGFSQSAGRKVAAIGRATAHALETIGIAADVVPQEAVAEALAKELVAHARQGDGKATRFLLVRAEEARDLLPETLRAAGGDVTIAPAYRNVIPSGSVEAIRQAFSRPETAPDAITFTSSSSARNLLALCDAAGVKLPERALRVSIGPITSGTMRELGYPPDAQAPEASILSLAETVARALKDRDRP